MIRALQNCAGRHQRPTTTSGRSYRLHYWREIHSRMGLGREASHDREPGSEWNPKSVAGLLWNCTSIVQSRQPTGGCSGSLETAGTGVKSSNLHLSFKYGFPDVWASHDGANRAGVRAQRIYTRINDFQPNIKKQCYMFDESPLIKLVIQKV